MLQVSATEFAKSFGHYKVRAQRGAIAITSHGRTSGYFVSEHEYRGYILLKERERHAGLSPLMDQANQDAPNPP